MRNKGISILTIILLVVMLLTITSCGGNENSLEEKYAYTFRLAESHPSDHPTTLADHEFARLVEEKSQGKIQIIIYDNKALGEEKEVIEQMRFGAIDFARVSSGPLTELVPSLNVIQLPYLYEDGEHMWRVLQSDLGRAYLKKVEDVDLIGFGWMDAGARSFYNRVRPIETIEDLEGLSFRVMQSRMMRDMVDVLGAKAIEMPYGEVYGAIQTGVIDGAENNWPSYDTSGHYEVAAYYSIDEHIRVPEILLGSAKALEKLSEAEMAILYEAAEETETFQRRLWSEHVQASEASLTGKGIKVNVILDRAAFRKAMIPLYEIYAGDALEVVRKIQEDY